MEGNHFIIPHTIYSVNKYLLNPHNMPGLGLGAGDTATNKSDKVFCLHGVFIRIWRNQLRNLKKERRNLRGEERVTLR